MNILVSKSKSMSESRQHVTATNIPFAKLEEVIKRRFYKPDRQALRIVLGTIQSHYLGVGDPAWLFVVAPPGTGKTTLSIAGACGLPEVVTLSDFTENTLLSGFYGHRDPGLLEQLGHTVQDGNTYTTKGNAIFLAKDFTSVLSMRHEKRAAILGQLREIHDGEFKRSFGTGDTKIWRGKVTIIAAVTPILDKYYSIFSVLGERFLQVRWHRPDSEEAGVWAIQQQGQEEQIRQEVREAIEGIFGKAAKSPPALSSSMTRRIACLAEIVALGRTHVIRNGYGSREIEYVPEPEANTRVSKGLAALAKGIASLNRRDEVAEQDLLDTWRVGLDCLPEVRRNLLLAALEGRDLESVQAARTVRERQVEELVALKILQEGPPVKPTKRVQELWSTAMGLSRSVRPTPLTQNLSIPDTSEQKPSQVAVTGEEQRQVALNRTEQSRPSGDAHSLDGVDCIPPGELAIVLRNARAFQDSGRVEPA